MSDASWFKAAPISLKEFQSDYWRKQSIHLVHDESLLLTLSDIDGAALMDLCLDDEVESRLVDHRDFNVEYGPFELSEIPSAQMLMVQNLESYLPSVADLLTTHFRFIPRWRIEDVMASYGHEGANCGAHFDHYDVFLIQLRGEKHWQLDNGGHGAGELRTDTDVRVLSAFEPKHKLTQKPGDILYIPPGIGHHGIASDDSLTLSVGIRNPTLIEMTSHLADLLIDKDQESRLLDDDLAGDRIQADTLHKLATLVIETLTEEQLIAEWYGTYMTDMRDPELIELPEQDWDLKQTTKFLQQSSTITAALPTRLAMIETRSGTRIFANGQRLTADLDQTDWFVALQQHRSIATSLIPLQTSNLEILRQLLSLGAIDLHNLTQ